MVTSPLMATLFLSPVLSLEGVAGLVFTSETGVEGLTRLTDRRDLPAHCVGAGTARAAAAAGFAVATTGTGDAAALAKMMSAQDGPLLWLRGEAAAADLVALLAERGIEARAAVVYRQATKPPAPAVLSALEGDAPVLLPLFSPRSARLAAAAFPALRGNPWVAAMSPAVAEAALPLAPRRVVVAARPDAAAMLDAVAALIDAAHPP